MSMKLFFRMLASVLIFAVLLVTAVGCEESSTPTLSPSPTVDPREGDGPMVKFKEPVEVTVSNYTSAAFSFIEGDDAENNIHTRMNEKYLNIVFKSKWLVDETKVDEKINLAIGSNDIPDVLSVNAAQLQSLIKNDQIEDLTSYWEFYPTDGFRENCEYQNKVAFLPATKDGKIYGIPLTSDFGESVPVLYVRKDWLDNLDLDAPSTIEELEAVAAAFVNDDPDKNSQKDTVAIALDSSLGRTTMVSIASAYGAYVGSWIDDGTGTLVYGSVQPAMKNALQKMQDLYKLGAFDVEFAVKDNSKVAEMLTAGKIGIYFGIYSGPIDPLMQNKLASPDADWEVLSIPALDSSSKVVPPAQPFTQRWVVVRKGFEHPEAAIKSMNLWYSTNYDEDSPEYEEWLEANSPGGPYEGKLAQVYAKPYYFQRVDGNLEISRILIEARDTGDESKLNAGGQTLMAIIKGGDALGWAFAKVFYESEVVISEYESIKYPDYLGAPTATMLSKGSSLAKLESETFIDIIMGAPISDFDDFVEQWHSLGGDQIAEEVNADQ